ncbi:MAG: hypothetical protein IT159_03170 [Bryobacterales bacterium]|nr:hypothetical protein [Bryobacterales bacterium]
MNHRFLAALSCYGLLGLAAAVTLNRLPRDLVWLLLAAMAVKTWIALKRSA